MTFRAASVAARVVALLHIRHCSSLGMGYSGARVYLTRSRHCCTVWVQASQRQPDGDGVCGRELWNKHPVNCTRNLLNCFAGQLSVRSSMQVLQSRCGCCVLSMLLISCGLITEGFDIIDKILHCGFVILCLGNPCENCINYILCYHRIVLSSLIFIR
jgi:hypothetical protein